MALKKLLSEEYTHLHYDFPQAYWRIENINFGTEGGEFFVRFELVCYPDQDAAWNTTEPQMLDFGTFAHTGKVLYRWLPLFRWSDISADPVPPSEGAQKKVLYPYLKQAVSYLQDAEDIFE